MSAPTTSPNQGYNYKRPRSINWVSILIGAALLIATYWGWKFGPVYYKRYKVDEVMQSAKTSADAIVRLTNQRDQEAVGNKILTDTTATLVGMGVSTIPVEQGGNGLQVFFDPGYKQIHAKYTVVVKHPFGKRTVMEFDRAQKIAANMKMD